jgi:uncharacterized repeat protein (TIGR01451 family)
MMDFFGKISGQIAGPLILGAFFPVVLFVLAVTVVVLPITPYKHELMTVVTDQKLWQQGGLAVIVITFVVLVLSVVLYNMNTPIIRLYEGYSWQHSRFGEWLAKRQRSRFEHATRWRRVIKKMRLEVRLAGFEEQLRVDDLIGIQRETARMLNDQFPDSVGLVLPTKLGNAIRSFETYTTRQYGVPAIALWPRLQGILDSTYAQALDGVKTAFDFMINSAFLGALLAVLVVVTGMIWQNPVKRGSDLTWMWWGLFFASISYLFYLAAIVRAAEWGAQVKAAFDLYRLPLLQKLGIEQKPANLTEERRMWNILNYKFSFPDDPSYPDLPYRAPQTFLTVDPVSTVVTYTRTMLPLESKEIQIRVVVSNTGSTRRDATRVVLRDDIPSGKVYVNESATVNGGRPILLDINPLTIDLGLIRYYETRTVVYRIQSQTA